MALKRIKFGIICLECYNIMNEHGA